VTWLLIFVPVTIGLEELASERYLLIFITSSLAILPLARWMGDATEQLATHFGEGVGGLLNATFGNAAELIIAVVALNSGLHEVVKASLAGSIIGSRAQAGEVVQDACCQEPVSPVDKMRREMVV